MQISYAITVCNEIDEICRLIIHLKNKIRKTDEIIILADQPKLPPQLTNLLKNWSRDEQIIVREDIFENDFSEWKNKFSTLCSGTYIFQIDADEMPHERLLENLPHLLKSNEQFDVFLVPRINTVENIQDEDLQRWNWTKNEKSWINFPDYQPRIYRNHHLIRWVNKVHETLKGYNVLTALPAEEEYSLSHKKMIEKQKIQNKFYTGLI